MSSSTSDSSQNISLLNTITSYVSYVQQQNIVTSERFRTIRRYFFQSIGLYVLLYCLFRILVSFYLFFKLLVYLIFQMLSFIVFLPFKFIEMLLPKTANYNVLVPSIWFCSILSFFIAKLSHKHIKTRLEKRYKSIKTYSLSLTFVLVLLFQTLFIILPLTASIKEQRRLVLDMNHTQQSGIKPTEKNVFQTDAQLSESRGINSDIESNVEDDLSHTIDRMTYSVKMAEKLPIYSKDENSLDGKNKLLLKDQLNNIVNPSQEFSSEVLGKLSLLEETNIKQIEETLLDILKEEKDKLIDINRSEQQETGTLHKKFMNLFGKIWNLWYKIKLNIQELFSTKTITNSPQNSSPFDVSSLYAAYVDLKCFDYTALISHSPLSKQKYISFLNIYRKISPLPIYISILESNGPQCYRDTSNSSCATNSKLVSSNVKQNLRRQAQFIFIISVLILIIIIIYRILKNNKYHKKIRQLSNENQKTLLNTTNELSLEQPILNKSQYIHRLDEKLEKIFRSWLENEQNNGYQKLSDACRLALNNTFSKKLERLNIETLQFANAQIHDIYQISFETIVISAVLDIVHLIFNIINTTKSQHYSIEIPKLTGDLRITVTSYPNHYTVEVKFEQIQLDNARVIDPKYVLSTDEKRATIKLLEETIKETIIYSCCNLSYNQESIINETGISRSIVPTRPESATNYQPCETPVLTSNSNNNVQLSPERHSKKLLVRVVKAVKLHDVEQPFCIIELNQPRQTHQTSIAKNGVNPFWDECFVFDSNEKSNQIRLKIIDRKKTTKKHQTHIVDTVYADVAIPFSYVTSESYKQDVRITPQHPDSIIRVEFSTFTTEEHAAANNSYDAQSITDSFTWFNMGRDANQTQSAYSGSPSDDIVTLPNNGNLSSKDTSYLNDSPNVASTISRQTITNSGADTLPITLHIAPSDNANKGNQPRKSKSFMSSFRRTIFHRRKKISNDQINDDDGTSSINLTVQSDLVSHSLSAEQCLSTSVPNPSNFKRGNSITRSFRNIFRSKANRRTFETSTITDDQRDSVVTSTPTPKKRSFFHRFKSQRKRQNDGSKNSLTSNDCTRPDSVRNTPVRANVGRPVTMTQKPVP